MGAVSNYRRSLGAAQPSPALRYDARSLSPQTVGVTTWPNQGQLGHGFDLLPASGMAPPGYVSAGVGMARPAVRFTGGDILETLPAFPATNGDFTLLLRFQQADTGGQRNIFGTGVNGFAQLRDLYISNNAVQLHTYGITRYGPGFAQSAWVTLAMRVRFAGGYAAYGGGYVEFNVNGQVSGGSDTLVWTDAPVRLGGGYYTPLNRGNELLVSHLSLYSSFLSDNDLTAALAAL